MELRNLLAMEQLQHLESGFQPSFAYLQFSILLYFSGEAVLSEQNIPENQRQHDTVFIKLKICTILCLGVHANVIEQYFKGEAIITHRSRDEACLSQPRWERGQQCCQAVGREVLEKVMMGSQDFILLLCLINYTGIIYIFPSNVILK